MKDVLALLRLMVSLFMEGISKRVTSYPTDETQGIMNDGCMQE